MIFDYKFVLGWTGIMVLGQFGFNIITLGWIWNYEFTALWLGIYVVIIPLGFLFALGEKNG